VSTIGAGLRGNQAAGTLADIDCAASGATRTRFRGIVDLNNCMRLRTVRAARFGPERPRNLPARRCRWRSAIRCAGRRGGPGSGLCWSGRRRPRQRVLRRAWSSRALVAWRRMVPATLLAWPCRILVRLGNLSPGRDGRRLLFRRDDLDRSRRRHEAGSGLAARGNQLEDVGGPPRVAGPRCLPHAPTTQTTHSTGFGSSKRQRQATQARDLRLSNSR
jgi:hypothetical protein